MVVSVVVVVAVVLGVEVPELPISKLLFSCPLTKLLCDVFM